MERARPATRATATGKRGAGSYSVRHRGAHALGLEPTHGRTGGAIAGLGAKTGEMLGRVQPAERFTPP